MKVIDVKIESHVDEVIEAAQEAIERALVICGMKAQGYATALSPTDTGRLRNSITFVTATEQGPANGFEGAKAGAEDYAPQATPEDNVMYLGTNVEYAPYQELGTKRMSAQPFLKPALQNHIEEYKRIIQDELKGAE